MQRVTVSSSSRILLNHVKQLYSTSNVVSRHPHISNIFQSPSDLEKTKHLKTSGTFKNKSHENHHHDDQNWSCDTSGSRLASLLAAGASSVLCLQLSGQSNDAICEPGTGLPTMQGGHQQQPASSLSDEEEPVSFYDLFSILDGEWFFLAAAIAVTLTFTLLNLYLPSAFSGVMTACREKLPLKAPIYTFMLLQGAIILLDGTRHFLMATLAERIRQKLRIKLYAAMLQQEIGFFDANSKGQLMSMMGEDVVRMQQAVTDQITNTLTSLTTIVYGAYKVLSISPYATLLVVAAVPVLSIASVAAQGASRKKAIRAHEAARETAAIASEVLNNARTVQSFCAEGKESERYEERMMQQYVMENEYRIFTGGAHLFFNAVNLMLSAGGMYYGGSLVAQGRITLENMMQFMQYSWKIGNALGSLMQILNEQQRALASASKVFGTLRRQPLIERGRGSQPNSIHGTLELQNVFFSYPTRPDVTVIRGLNLTLNPGTITALVGGSGNGKSTIAVLLQRFYDPDSGHIKLDGRDLRQLDLEWLRSKLATVSQEPMLFHGSVADNIRYGKPHATDEEVIRAAREANAEEFINKLPQGYETMVSQVGLSAGQRQRLSIARAILKDPKILILDEATSQLDARSEGAVQEALDRLMKGRTVLVIAHRLSTIKDATCICVLEDGEIVEKGTHQELMKLQGMYSVMAKHQMAGAKSMGA